MANLGTVDDWDGGRIWLEAGETLTLTNQTRGGNYWLAIDDDNDTNPIQPAGMPQTGGYEFTWDTAQWTTNGVGPQSVSHTADADGWYYFGVGSVAGLTLEQGPGYDYTTLVTITPSIEDGGYDYTANDGALSDSAHVAIAGSAGSSLVGTAGADILISGPNGDTLDGGGGDDVLIGRAGNDTMTGGAGRDLFFFDDDPNVVGNLGDNDTIMDFSTGDGDIINLDALFDFLGVPDGSTDREVLTTDSGGDAVLTIGNGSGGAHAGATGFSITLTGEAGLTATDIDDLIANGNLVVDES
jgi:hypothetical protein